MIFHKARLFKLFKQGVISPTSRSGLRWVACHSASHDSLAAEHNEDSKNSVISKAMAPLQWKFQETRCQIVSKCRSNAFYFVQCNHICRLRLARPLASSRYCRACSIECCSTYSASSTDNRACAVLSKNIRIIPISQRAHTRRVLLEKKKSKWKHRAHARITLPKM